VVYCFPIFFYKVGDANPMAIYAKSLVATAGNYIAGEYWGTDPIFPTTYEALAAEELKESPTSISINFDDDELTEQTE
jgi:hypothetical protein